jgi:hypothetical protein
MFIIYIHTKFGIHSSRIFSLLLYYHFAFYKNMSTKGACFSYATVATNYTNLHIPYADIHLFLYLHSTNHNGVTKKITDIELINVMWIFAYTKHIA